MTARDVAATYASILDPATASPKRAALGSLARVEPTSAHSVRFVLAEPDAAFLESATIGVLPERLAGRRALATTEVVGCGPYRLAASNEASLRLERSSFWFGETPTLAAMEVRTVPDAVMRALQLARSEVDLVANALEPDDAAAIAAGDAHARVVVANYDAYQYLGVNHRSPILSRLDVRRALAHAIDREAIVRHLLRGQAELASGLLPPHHYAFEPRVRRYRYDPSRARRLLDRAGLPDPDGAGPRPRFSLRYSTSTAELRRRIAEVIAANLAEVGIAIDVESHEWGTFYADLARGDFDLYSLAWVAIRDPDLYRTALASRMLPPAGSNRGAYADAPLDRLLDLGRRELDPSARARIYRKVQRRAARRLPYVSLWWPNNVVGLSARVEGFEPDSSGSLYPVTKARLREN